MQRLPVPVDLMYVPGISHRHICDTRRPYRERNHPIYHCSCGHLPCRTSYQRERGTERFQNHRLEHLRFDNGVLN